MTQSPHSKSKYARAKALVVDFIALNRGRCLPHNWGYLGHLIWCRAQQDGAFKFELLRIACFHLAKQAITKPLPTLIVED